MGDIINVINSKADEIIKLIYLRRNFELMSDLGDEYQVLSNLFHKRTKEECKDFRKQIGNDLMSDDDFKKGLNEIKKVLPDFNYESCLLKLSDKSQIKVLYQATDNGYEKLHLFRVLFEESLNELGSVLRKFINESYHIENELICQLDPSEFDLIPSFVINECTRYVENSHLSVQPLSA